MNENNKNRVKDFLRREGFYFVLFLCLCVVATAAAIAMKKNSASKQQDKPSNEFTLNVDDTETSNGQLQNAERVENGTTDEVADNTEVEVADNTEVVEEATVSNTNTEITLALPLQGTVSRAFGVMVRIQNNNQGVVDTTRRGIDIEAPVGTVVTAAAEGKVQEVGSSTEEGNYVVIAHANGLTTKYANLDQQVSVAVGDTVVEGTEIGKVGNSSKIFTSEICGDVLNLQVQDANGKQVDPTKYFSF